MSSLGALIAVKADVPPEPRTAAFKRHRQRLPIFKQRDEILEKIKQNRVTIVKGPAGSGKTTQVPQYILEDSTATGEPVRIIACIPRRVGVVAVCDRVTEERGERVGHTVGYTIRLESCTSPCETLLTFCTAPILVSALASPGCKLETLETATHIILDEVHGRDRYTDFLLTLFRDVADYYPNLKFIFLGEDIRLDFLVDYFEEVGSVGQVSIDPTDVNVKVFYVDQILDLLEKSNEQHRKTLVSTQQKQQVEQQSNHEIDKLIQDAWKDGNKSSVQEFLKLIKCGEVPVDYQHSKTSLTMLMAVATSGNTQAVEELIASGADLAIKSSNGYSAFDWAKSLSQVDILRLLEWERMAKGGQITPQEFSPFEKQYKGSSYRQPVRVTSDDEQLEVDLELVKDLIHMIYLRDTVGGSILVFVPTYDDMATLKQMLCESSMGSEFFVVYFLHPHIQTGDHRAAFDPSKPGVRKIILSTSIGESCITFDDIMFVIDSGINREYYYDDVTGLSSIKQCWISKSAANLRKERAGSIVSGKCYRLYSESCFKREMEDFPIPEMCRAPLSVMCLQSRAVGYEVSIEEFFSSVPNPPPLTMVQSSIEHLNSLGALDEKEDLTDLGIHLLDYPIEPALSKAVLYSIIFRCMDPILTLTAAISYGDTYAHQSDPKLKALAFKCKVTLSEGTLSDHMALLKAIQEWEEVKSYRDGDEDNYCRTNHLSAPAFEIIYSIRGRLLGQLRASGFVRNKGVGDVKYLNSNSDNWAVVKAVLTGAFYPNLCRTSPVTKTLFNDQFERVRFHDTSVLSSIKSDWFREFPSDWLIFDEMYPDRKLLKGCTLVSSATVALFAGKQLVQVQDLSPALDSQENRVTTIHHSPRGGSQIPVNNMYCLMIDNWTTMIRLDISLSEILELREKINTAVVQRLRRPASFPTKDDHNTIMTIARILSTEDNKIGFRSVNVGQWPKLVAGNLMSTPRSGFEITQHGSKEESTDDTIVLQ